jgi:hypothetical protein
MDDSGRTGRLYSSLLFHDRRKVFSEKNLLGGTKSLMGGDKKLSLVPFSYPSACYGVALFCTGIFCFERDL